MREFCQYEFSAHEAAEGFRLVDLAMQGTALVQSEDEEVLGLGLHAVGQDEGFVHSVGTVDLLQDVCQRFGPLQFGDFSLLLLAGQQIQEDVAVGLLASLAAHYDVLVEHEVELEDEVIQQHVIFAIGLLGFVFNFCWALLDEAIADILE